jgi:hypothetical protein
MATVCTVPNIKISESFIKPIQVFPDGEHVTYEELHDAALFDCPYSAPAEKKQKILSTLIDIERSHDLPPSLRGMLLAAACHESGYNPKAKGDRKFSKNNKPKAIGLFQMWPWWEKAYKIDRRNPEQSAEAYLQHVKSKIEKVKYACRYRSVERTWLSAWATAIRAPKKSGRCGERPKFYSILKKWHKSIKEDRKVDNECYDEDPCGC